MLTPQAQLHNSTYIFRDIGIYTTVAHKLGHLSTPKILSFGCSIGDEIATLRAFFPDASLFACDIDEHALSVARASAGHLAMIFESTAANIQAHGPYDMVVAASVLCRNPPGDITERFPFAHFQDLVGLLDSVVVPGGLLVITNASYRLADVTGIARYTPVRADILNPTNFVDVFLPDGTPFLIQKTIGSLKAYCRGPGFSANHDEELCDRIFQKEGEESGQPRMLQLSAVPADFTPNASFTRKLSHIKSADPLHGLIDICVTHGFGQHPQTSEQGYTVTYSWTSVVKPDEEHIRPSTWHRLG